jgi:putative MATE family efflux protein
MQNTFWPMLISIIGASLNVGLDFILVFGIEGFIPEMKIEGAAWASVISQAVMAILALFLMLKKTPFSLKFSLPFHSEIKRLLSLSFNLIIRTTALNIALYLANSYATRYGTNYIAAQTIAFQIWLFFAFFIDGYSSVGNIMSGKLLGEKDHKKIWNLSIVLSRYTIMISILLGMICLAFYFPIGKLFSREDEVLQLFYSIFWIVILMQPINSIAFVFDGIFKGLAEAIILRNTLLVATFLGFVPALFIGDYFDLKLYAIWIAFTVWMIFRSGILVIIFRRKFHIYL